jgi:hypothetical protein
MRFPMQKDIRLLLDRWTGNKIYRVVSSDGYTDNDRTDLESKSHNVYRRPIGGSGRRYNRRRLD